MPPCEVPFRSGMTRSASSDGLGFKVHFASRGGIKRHTSLMPVNVNGQSRHIPEEDEDFRSHKPLGRNNTFSVKNQSRWRYDLLFILECFYYFCLEIKGATSISITLSKV